MLALRPTPGTRLSFFESWAIPTSLEGAYGFLEKKPLPVVLAIYNIRSTAETLVAVQSVDDLVFLSTIPDVQFGWVYLETLKRFPIGWTPEELDEKLN